jgi:hypothetical protein
VRFQAGLPLVALILMMPIVSGVSAASTAPAADPLFESHQVLAIRIAGPLRGLARDRSQEPDDRPATLSYAGPDGVLQTLPVGVRPRGHSRRDREVCVVPPLRVNVQKKAVAGTLFDGQDKLKLVTHCRRQARHDGYVYKEYLAYRILNEITDASFRVRGLDIEWVDEDRGGSAERRFGFFIEHKDRLARRLGLEVAEPESIDSDRLEAEHASLMELFQFMIGNTDFSFIAGPEDDDCCHNATLLVDPQGRYLPMPYDFDITGFVDPPYAVVDQQLPIKKVRQRLYRGFCRDGDAHAQAVERFRRARPAIDALVRTETALEARSRAAAQAFVDGFYAVLDDPDDLERYVLGACRGRVRG